MEVRGQEKDLFFIDQNQAQTQTQTLDHHHHHPLYRELNLRQKPRGDPPDPVSDPLGATTSPAAAAAAAGGSGLLEITPLTTSPPTASAAAAPSIRYRECQKNHAAAMGGHVYDGCGEFMPCGDEGTPEALKCAACECHRNFHRKEVDGQTQNAAGRQNHTHKHTRRDAITITPSLPPPTAPGGQAQTAQHQHHRHHHRFVSPIAPMMMAFGGGGAAAESSSGDLNMYQHQPNNNNNNLQGLSRKRFRTKFSTEQKEKMMEFAEKIQWKIQKQDEEQVQQFCGQLGVKRQVFKVWMHNNKKKL